MVFSINSHKIKSLSQTVYAQYPSYTSSGKFQKIQEVDEKINWVLLLQKVRPRCWCIQNITMLKQNFFTGNFIIVKIAPHEKGAAQKPMLLIHPTSSKIYPYLQNLTCLTLYIFKDIFKQPNYNFYILNQMINN